TSVASRVAWLQALRYPYAPQEDTFSGAYGRLNGMTGGYGHFSEVPGDYVHLSPASGAHVHNHVPRVRSPHTAPAPRPRPHAPSVAHSVPPAHDEPFVGRVDDCGVLPLVVELVEEVAHRVEPRPLLVIRLDGDPRGEVGVSAHEHRLLRRGVVLPPVQRLEVHRRELPLPHRIDLADREAGALLRLRDGEPELRHVDAGVDEHLLEDRRLLHEGLVLVV